MGTPERYEARLKRDRLNRQLLVEYLATMKIFVDDPDYFGAAQSIRADVAWAHRVRRETVEEFRVENGWE